MNKNRLRFVILSVFALTALDLGIQFYGQIKANHDELLRLSIIYGKSPYFGPDFQREQQTVGTILVWDSSADRWRGTFHGKYYNIVDGWRQVTDTPQTWEHTIWLFGSSTVRDSAVPDWYTKASYLQRDFNLAGYRYRILNRSDDGVSLQDNVTWLKQSDVKPDDIVVFYGGGHEQDAEHYQSVIQQAYRIAMTHGAAFYNFLEPHIYTIPLSTNEKIVVSNVKLVPPGDETEVLRRWAILEPAARKMATLGIASFDLTHVLDGIRRQGADIFVDSIHTNEYGNIIVANAIYNYLTVI